MFCHHGHDDHWEAAVHGEDADEAGECQKGEGVANAKAWVRSSDMVLVLPVTIQHLYCIL